MSLRWGDAERTLDLGVGDLLDSSSSHLRRGLASGSTWRMAMGRELHKEVQATQVGGDPAYQTEVTVRHTLVRRGWTVRIHGRLDGLTVENGRFVVEEVKSTALTEQGLAEMDRFPGWEAQLDLYLWLVAAVRGGNPIGRLRVVSLQDGAQRLWHRQQKPEVEAEILGYLDHLLLTRERRLSWLAGRRAAPIPFPHGSFRPGQEEVSKTVERVILAGRHLLLEAPTGLGKTAAVLHGALRASAALGLRIFYATARATQSWAVEATLRSMKASLRTVSLRARPNLCLTGTLDCRPEACRYAERYYERMRSQDVVESLKGIQTVEALRAAGDAAVVCPYQLGMDAIEAADVVIGDYNYLFDPDGNIRRNEPWIVLLDEAHQLPDRAVGYGSPAIHVSAVAAARASVPHDEKALVALLEEVEGELADLPLLVVEPVPGPEQVVELSLRRWTELADRFDELSLDHARVGGPTPWTELADAVRRFAGALSRGGEETVAIASDAGVRLLCRDPSPLLGPRFESFHASVSLSATLSPSWWIRDRLGLHPDRTEELSVPSPFPPEHRPVWLVPGVSTAFRHRARDREAVGEVVSKVTLAVPGNVAVFFSSFEQRSDLAPALSFGDRELLWQTQQMGEPEREGVMERLRAGGAPKVLLGVLGGLFAEGIDLPGAALRGVVVVGPSLPVPGLALSLQQAWAEERWGDGFVLSSVRPGMTRVIQAAGRVVRSEEDRGVVVLVCQRFMQHQFFDCLPSEWVVAKSRKPWVEVAAFWKEQGFAPIAPTEAAPVEVAPGGKAAAARAAVARLAAAKAAGKAEGLVAGGRKRKGTKRQ